MPSLGKRHYKTISREFEQAILDLADEHPSLGQDALQDEVERLGIKPDPHELKLFLHDHNHPPKRRPYVGYRRRGIFDIGWPLWGNRSPIGDMDWPNGEPFAVRYPFWAWMNRQPMWFRIVVAATFFVPFLLGVYALFTQR